MGLNPGLPCHGPLDPELPSGRHGGCIYPAHGHPQPPGKLLTWDESKSQGAPWGRAAPMGEAGQADRDTGPLGLPADPPGKECSGLKPPAPASEPPQPQCSSGAAPSSSLCRVGQGVNRSWGVHAPDEPPSEAGEAQHRVYSGVAPGYPRAHHCTESQVHRRGGGLCG